MHAFQAGHFVRGAIGLPVLTFALLCTVPHAGAQTSKNKPLLKNSSQRIIGRTRQIAVTRKGGASINRSLSRAGARAAAKLKTRQISVEPAKKLKPFIAAPKAPRPSGGGTGTKFIVAPKAPKGGGGTTQKIVAPKAPSGGGGGKVLTPKIAVPKAPRPPETQRIEVAKSPRPPRVRPDAPERLATAAGRPIDGGKKATVGEVQPSAALGAGKDPAQPKTAPGAKPDVPVERWHPDDRYAYGDEDEDAYDEEPYGYSTRGYGDYGYWSTRPHHRSYGGYGYGRSGYYGGRGCH